MQLLTDAWMLYLIAKGRGRQDDPMPEIHLFTPDAGAAWLLAELDPDDPDIGFGLCDLGLGHPEVGYVRLSEIGALNDQLGLPVERNLGFMPVARLSAYARAARHAGRIVTEPTLVLAKG